MMVSIGCAIFVIGGLAIVGEQSESVTRVIQGITAGIGFFGAGTILKLDEEQEIKGLTTASSIWLASALGTTAGWPSMHSPSPRRLYHCSSWRVLGAAGKSLRAAASGVS